MGRCGLKLKPKAKEMAKSPRMSQMTSLTTAKQRKHTTMASSQVDGKTSNMPNYKLLNIKERDI
jgi:hypothetical protein